MTRKRVHILTTVNAGAVSKYADEKTGRQMYRVANVCGAVDGIVMNGMAYMADQLADGAPSLEGKPATAGHPQNAEGQYISALNGEALLTAYAGAVCRNARHEGGRTLVDVVINEAQARAHPDGVKVVERLDAAIAGTNSEPIHVSTGLYCEPITANGESGGKLYDRIATQIRYDHLAILMNEQGAGTPDQGVGMFLNAAGQAEPVEAVRLDGWPEDKRSAGLKRWLLRLLGNGSSELSFDQISSALYEGLPEGAWLRDVFDRYAVWTDRDGAFWRQDYTVSSDGSVAWSGTAVQVTRKVEYEPINNVKEDPMKDLILSALNAAGINTAGKTDQQLLQDFEALKAKPHVDALNAANSKVAEFEANARAAQEAEAQDLATELATNSSLTVEDLKKLGVNRLRELKAKAAPVLPGAGGAKPGDEFAAYDVNALIDAAGKSGAAATH